MKRKAFTDEITAEMNAAIERLTRSMEREWIRAQEAAQRKLDAGAVAR